MTEAEWMAYHTSVSMGIESDAEFAEVVCKPWGLHPAVLLDHAAFKSTATSDNFAIRRSNFKFE